jgi:chromosome segregation ATPase
MTASELQADINALRARQDELVNRNEALSAKLAEAAAARAALFAAGRDVPAAANQDIASLQSEADGLADAIRILEQKIVPLSRRLGELADAEAVAAQRLNVERATAAATAARDALGAAIDTFLRETFSTLLKEVEDAQLAGRAAVDSLHQVEDLQGRPHSYHAWAVDPHRNAGEFRVVQSLRGMASRIG